MKNDLSTKMLILEYIKLTYPITLVFPLITVIVLSFIAAQKIFLTFELILVIFLAIIWTIIANTINQVSDYDIDKINFLDTPLVTQSISPKKVIFLAINLILISFILAFYLGQQIVLLNILAIIVAVIYSFEPFRLKKRTFLSHITIAIGYGVLVPILAFFVFSNNLRIEIVSIVFLTAVLMSMQKDYRDKIGDSWAGIKTFVVTLGEFASLFHLAFIVLPFITIIFLINKKILPTTYYLVLFGSIPISLAFYYAIKNKNKPKIKLAYPYMIISASILIILIGIVELIQ